MIHSKTIWTIAIALSVIAHFVIFMLYYQSATDHGDDGYLEVELSLENPKNDERTQTKQSLPAPPKLHALPKMPETVEIEPFDLDFTPTIDISPEEVSELPALSLEVESFTDSFDTLGESTTLFYGSSTSDESARSSGKDSVENNYLKRVSTRIHRFKQYPREARIAKIEGTVIMQLTLKSDGSVRDKKITTSSDIDIFDAEALAIIERAEPFPKFPTALVEKIGSQLKFSTSINFKLSESE